MLRQDYGGFDVASDNKEGCPRVEQQKVQEANLVVRLGLPSVGDEFLETPIRKSCANIFLLSY